METVNASECDGVRMEINWLLPEHVAVEPYRLEENREGMENERRRRIARHRG
jgi:hypothetical protein